MDPNTGNGVGSNPLPGGSAAPLPAPTGERKRSRAGRLWDRLKGKTKDQIDGTATAPRQADPSRAPNIDPRPPRRSAGSPPPTVRFASDPPVSPVTSIDEETTPLPPQQSPGSPGSPGTTPESPTPHVDTPPAYSPEDPFSPGAGSPQ
ncbi:hypothetical protein BCR39DRAFT_174605 [Naematelia encephala]|uniref:Uncharacterized protein n=1 Tax=Naematelia encephala TaxID=71784 RepID=A0A1Y2B3D4_9TREE|nr:hypothetical protein BCR39DRAFT_174605 [Naematelia encephala]